MLNVKYRTHNGGRRPDTPTFRPYVTHLTPASQKTRVDCFYPQYPMTRRLLRVDAPGLPNKDRFIEDDLRCRYHSKLDLKLVLLRSLTLSLREPMWPPEELSPKGWFFLSFTGTDSNIIKRCIRERINFIRIFTKVSSSTNIDMKCIFSLSNITNKKKSSVSLLFDPVNICLRVLFNYIGSR